MTEPEDSRLLREFAEQRSDAAFGELVRRHVNLVYSVALRQTGHPHQAEEITQAVFIILARKAGSLGPKTILSGWLYQTTRLTAANFLRAERRRAFREQEAYMQSLGHEPGPEDWAQIAPLLEEAMGKLGERDRNALVLRFFEQKSLHDVGLAMGASEDAAKMRVNRALEKLRKFFGQRGVTLAAAAIAGALSTNAVGAAPADLRAQASAAVANSSVASGSTLALVNATLKTLVWIKIKVALAVGAAGLVVGGTVATVLWLRPPAAPSAPPSASMPQVVTPITAEAATPVTPPQPAAREPFSTTVHMTLGVPPGAVALQPDGKIVLGTTLSGFFIDEQSGVLGAYHRGAIRFQPDGVLDRTFHCQVDDSNACDPMRAHLELKPDGGLLMTGLFKSVEGKPRFNYAMLRANGGLDESFEPWRGTTNQAASVFNQSATFPAAMLTDGSVAVGNAAVEGRRAPYPTTAYRLEPNGRMGSLVQTELPSQGFSRPSGLMLTLGTAGFWARKPVDWERDAPAARRTFHYPPGQEPPVGELVFDQWDQPPTARQATVVLQALFDEVPLELCRYAVRLPEGGFILAVRTKATDGSRIAGGRFMRFDRDWRPDLTFTNHYDVDLGCCMTLKLQRDGKLLVAGLAGKLNGETFPGLVRLEKDGAIDRSFHCETAESITGDPVLDPLRRRVIGLALQDDGRIVISGFFTKVNGVECPHVARLNPDGSLDATFRTPFTTWEGLKAWRRVRVQSLAQVKKTAAANLGAGALAEEPEAPPETVLITSLNLDGSGAAIQFTGSPRQVYILQGADSLDSATWSNLSTNRANAKGLGGFRDDAAKSHPMRFYRIARP